MFKYRDFSQKKEGLNIQQIVALIAAKTGYQPRPSQRGHTGRCPAHNDKYPSLSITESDGKILIHCFRGCFFNDICNALGINQSDLFSQQKKGF
jgi:hypothetical protein